MSNSLVEFEQRLEPFVERFDGLAVPPIGCPAAVVGTVLETSPMRFIAGNGRFGFRVRLGVAAVFRAQKPPTRSLPCSGPFDAYSQVVAVVTCVSRDRPGLLR